MCLRCGSLKESDLQVFRVCIFSSSKLSEYATLNKFWTWTGHIPIGWWNRGTGFDVHVTVHRDKFLIIKPTKCTNFSNLFLKWNSTCFGEFLCPPSRAFYCTHSNVICHTGLLTAASRIRTELQFRPDPAHN